MLFYIVFLRLNTVRRCFALRFQIFLFGLDSCFLLSFAFSLFYGSFISRRLFVGVIVFLRFRGIFVRFRLVLNRLWLFVRSFGFSRCRFLIFRCFIFPCFNLLSVLFDFVLRISLAFMINCIGSCVSSTFNSF